MRATWRPQAARRGGSGNSSGSRSRNGSSSRPPAAPAAHAEAHARGAGGARVRYDVRVCTNRTCKRQGSQQVLKFLQDLALEGVEASACGCLGQCGSGPSVAIANVAGGGTAEPIRLSHVASPHDAAEALQLVCDVQINDADITAVTTRLTGNALAQDGDLAGAAAKFSEGISASPRHGAHLLLCNRSAVFLQMGRREDALADALAALHAAPPGFAKAWIRVVDAYYALGRYADAADAVEEAVRAHPEFSRLPELKAAQQALQRAGQRRVKM